MDLFSYITKLQTSVFAHRNDDDIADRLNYRYTVAILCAFAVIVSNRQFSETVIKCWVPAFFTPNYEAYANQVCWISNTYFVNQHSNMPKTDDVKKGSEIKYYQWIPFILLIQALFLYIPRIMWRLLTARAGLDMRDLIEAAHSYKSVEKYSNKKKIMEYIVQNIDQYASNPRRSKHRHSIFQKIKYFGESLFCGAGIYLGNYLVTTYFFIKIAYLFNSIGQFYLMNEFLGKQFHQLGIDILRYITNTYSIENSIESVYFPKVVMCDFKIREFGHPNFSHRYTIQCVLPINLYNQQIFTFLWFWFLILFCANLWALVKWMNRMMPGVRRHYINKRLNMLKYFKDLNQSTSVIQAKGILQRKKSVSEESRRQKRKFINDYLKFDGVFILQMISMLTSEIVGTEILHELWNKRGVYKEIDPQNISTNDSTNYDNFQPSFKPYSSHHKKNDDFQTQIKPNPVPSYNQSMSWPQTTDEPKKDLTNFFKKSFLTVTTPRKLGVRHKQLSVLDTLNVNRTKQMRINRTRSLRSNLTDDSSRPDRKLMSTSSADSFKIKQKRVAFASNVKAEEEENENELNDDNQLDNMDEVFSDIKIDATEELTGDYSLNPTNNNAKNRNNNNNNNKSEEF